MLLLLFARAKLHKLSENAAGKDKNIKNSEKYGGEEPESIIVWVPMCCPQGGESITSLIVSSLKFRADRHKG